MTETLTADEYNALNQAKQSKYRNQRTEVDGITFDSKAEARRYGELCLLQEAGEIEDLTLQPKFELMVHGSRIGTYIADFFYWDLRSMKPVWEDTKGVRTPVYRLKKRLVKAIYNIDILETS